MQTWVVAMSSSHLRAFRHTATVIALEVETALCEVAAELEKEAETNSRQKGGEQKRKAKAKQTAPTAREKEIDAKGNIIRERRGKLAEFLKEFVDGYEILPHSSNKPVIIHVSFSACSSTDTGTLILVLDLNVFGRWGSGSRSTHPTSLRIPTFVT